MRNLVGGMAHRFNDLHAIIQGQADQLLEQLHERDPLRRDLEIIRNTAVRGAALTRKLMAVSERQVLHPATFCINELLEALQLELTRMAGPGRQVQLALAPELGYVCADAPQVRQLVLELTRNSLDAIGPQGLVTIETSNADWDASRLHPQPAEGGSPFVTVSITDSGPGIPEAAIPRLFEPFFTTKEPSDSIGLGLSASRGFLRQSGGQLWLRSTGPAGTTFAFTLPRVSRTIPLGSVESVPKTSVDAPSKAATVLVVEDEQTHRTLIRTVLQRHGFEVLEARNGREALMLCDFHKEAIDLILSDVTMPQMGGAEFRDRLVQLHSHVPLVLMSGYSPEVLLSRGDLLAGAEFLQKPIHAADLIETLLRALKKRK